jgi:hypothetical protein
MNELLLEALHAGPTTVSFTNATGERRDMRCTLNSDIVPPSTTDALREPRKRNPDVQPVWDIEKAAWRSFRWDRVITDG